MPKWVASNLKYVTFPKRAIYFLLAFVNIQIQFIVKIELSIDLVQTKITKRTKNPPSFVDLPISNIYLI